MERPCLFFSYLVFVTPGSLASISSRLKRLADRPGLAQRGPRPPVGGDLNPKLEAAEGYARGLVETLGEGETHIHVVSTELFQLKLDGRTHDWASRAREELTYVLSSLAEECHELSAFYKALGETLSQGRRLIASAVTSNRSVGQAATFWAKESLDVGDSFRRLSGPGSDMSNLKDKVDKDPHLGP